jgi:hypothetical protein
MPWLLVPFLPVLLVSAQIFPGMGIYLPLLLIPVGAWLGHRFGTAGFVTLLLGALLALGPVFSIGWFGVGGGLAIYFLSLAVCRAAMLPAPLAALPGESRVWKHPALLVVVLLFLPLSFSFSSWEIADGVSAAWYVIFPPLLVFAMFLVGRAGLGAGRALAGLAVATAFGMLAAGFGWGEGVVKGAVSIRYQLDDLAMLITALSAFYAGGAVFTPNDPNLDYPGNPWRHPYPVVALLVVIALMPNLTTPLLPEMPLTASYLGLHGQYLALPLAAFMAGVLRGFAGLGFTLGLVLVLMLIGNLGSLYVSERGLWLDLEQPIVAVTFAYLGLRLTDVMRGAHRAWPGKGWYLYAGLVLLFLPSLFSLDEMIALLLPFLTALAAALLAALALRLRQRLQAAGITITGDGWLKLAMLVAIVIGAVANLGAIVNFVFDLAWQYDLPPEIALPMIILLLHLPLAVMARMLADIWPKIAGDLRNISAWWRKTRDAGPDAAN